MTLSLAAIADDYTGASDLANTWRKEGLRTVQTIGVPAGNGDFHDIDAVVVSLKIRSALPEQAVAGALRADAFLRRIGVPHVMYKICSTFDSTDRGNIGPVSDALRTAAGADWTMVSPAFPETGRTVYQGHLFVGSALLNESPLKDHPLNPMHDANLVRVLARQTKHPVRSLDLQTLHQGLSSCRMRLKPDADGPFAIIADAVSKDDLDRIGELAIGSPVSTGASGLGFGLARAVLKTRPGRAGLASLEPAGGGIAVIAGSCSKRTLEQIAAVENRVPTLRLMSDRLIASGEGVAEAVAFADCHIGRGPVLIAASDTPESVRRIQQKYGMETAGAAIEAGLAEIAKRLVEMGVRRLVVAGGETSGAVVDALQVERFEVGEELAPGVPVLRTIGREAGNLMMVLKSGNFGGTGFFRQAIEHLR